MAPRKAGGDSGGGPKGRRGSRPSEPSGIEKYGKDEVDDFLDLDAGDDEASEAESSLCEEEDVMAIDAEADDDEDWSAPKLSSKDRGSIEDKTKDSDEEANLEPGSKGWRKHEFYGGEDGGDDSEEDSDEDLIFEEAKRLEDLRAQQLTGEEDPLAALLAGPGGAEEPVSVKVTKIPAAAGAATSAHFESVFAGEAETISTHRDISELAAPERKRLMKKEAPELLPLLGDFKVKLAGLRELLPMLRPAVLKQLPASGAAYLEAKATLLLNTLANLSFYLLLRAEGGAVKAHPVIPQLVWLRELHQQLAPLDTKLGKKMSKALAAARHVSDSIESPSVLAEERAPMGSDPSNVQRQAGTSTMPRKKKTLLQRLERMQLSAPAAPAVGKASANKEDSQRSLLTKDLLRLPKAKKAAATGSASAPADLDDIDPSLGVWAPKSSIGEQLSQVQQQMKEHATRAQAARSSADQNPEAKPRVARKERGATLPEEEDTPGHKEASDLLAAETAADDDDEPDLIKSARRIAELKKQKHATNARVEGDAKEEARRLRQYHPELKEDGKRKATKKILTNRGLARVRKKKAGNARVMNKDKYNKALKRRKGAVQEMREGEGDGATYGGEATGIRTHLKKSMKLGT